MFHKILIANRGEIAVRVIRACREMGIATVAVFSEADASALFVSMADESICIGGARAADSYLNMTAVLSAAIATGAEAIHPGYGLLSENPKFVAMCEQCGIAFIGPTSELIHKMGDKDMARRTMIAAGVPVIPGSDVIADAAEAERKACEIGFPVMVKAKAGGGGRGIRIVRERAAFQKAFLSASSEAESAFGDGACYLEKYLKPVKHIEMQILCDNYGGVVCLGERECSVQRKNQKLIEESPSPAISAETRAAMIEASTKAAKAVGYRGVGTIEYLYDQSGNFYFMEMNTRLQVEHPVTEMVTGIDLVQWQIRVAAGVELPFTQKDIRIDGAAIECRINAEDPDKNFAPSCGTIELLHIPGGPWVRFDTAIYQDYFIPPFYDSMIGKLIVHAQNREQAIRKMKMALSELVIEGVTHNADFQALLLDNPAFVDGSYDTGLLDDLNK